jgi:FkbM family methyltransferase
MLIESLLSSVSRDEPSARHEAASPAAAHRPVRLFQIVYSKETLGTVEPGYEILDNLSNERPDWYEYWPIRAFLLRESLDEDAFYGFFSPKFRTKTNLSHADALRFIEQHEATADVVLFSPQPDMGAFFLNVFEQGELFDPGLIQTVNQALVAIGMPVDVTGLVMDSRQIVFSNYFAARPRFWREWLRITEAFFTICEGPSGAVKDLLCQPTTYPGAAQRKVFVQERVASLMLTVQPGWRSVAFNPFGMAWSTLPFRDHPHEAFVSDALKAAHRDRDYPQFLAAFATVRRQLTTPGAKRTVEASGFESGQVVKLMHPSWTADVVIDAEGKRLQHSLHGSQASFFRHEDLLLVAWDGYDPEVFRRDGDLFRAVSVDHASTLLDAARSGRLSVGTWQPEVESVSVRLPNGMGSVHVRPGTSDIPVLDSIFRRHDYEIGRLIPDCFHIVDLGANTGLASVFFAQRFPAASVVAVEPARDNYRLLATNALFRPSIIPVEAAIASRDGQLALQDRGPSGEELHAWAYRTVDQASGVGSYNVQALSIPTLMRRYGLGFIDVLKVDIEGAEFDLFSAGTELWLSRVRLILVETHERFVPGVDALLSDVLGREFTELPGLGECRVFGRLA